MIRLFAALAVPDDIAEALLDCQQDLKGAKWRPREALHLTLRFFGEIDEQRADALDDALFAIRQSAFEVALQGVGAFAGDDRRTALYAGAMDSEPLRRLAQKCEAAARRAGLKGETRAYRPHVTLAYIAGDPGALVAGWIARNNLLRTSSWPVRQFLLYSSRMSREGSRYLIEREYPLL
jgi:2'-5' RNA ligase